jgi:hypothetical protein
VNFRTAFVLGTLSFTCCWTLSPSVHAASDPAALKAFQDAKAEMDKDTKAQKELKAKLTTNCKNSDEYHTAQDNLKKAEADLKAAQTPVLEALAKDPKYKAASEKQVQADLALRELQKGNPTAEQLTSATEAMVNSGAEVNKMKNDAMQAAPAIAEAKTKLQAAKDALKALEAKCDESLAADPDYQAATKLVDADKQKVDDAKKALADAQKQAAAQRQSTPRQNSTPSAPRGGAGGGGGRKY